MKFKWQTGLTAMLVTWFLLGATIRSACSAPSEPAATLQVVTTIYPLTQAVEDLGAGLVSVHTLIPRNASPHDFSLRVKDVRAIQSADLLVWLGAEAEPAFVQGARQAQAQLALADLEEARLLKLGHDHEDHGHHSIDPHLWWSPHNMMILGAALREFFARQYPEHRQQFIQGYEQWQFELRSVVDRYRPLLEGQGKQILVYHESLDYLATELGFEPGMSLMQMSGKNPGAKQVFAVRNAVEKGNLTCLILEPGYHPSWIDKIDPQHRLKLVEIDPLGWLPSLSDGSHQEASTEAATGFKTVGRFERALQAIARCVQPTTK